MSFANYWQYHHIYVQPIWKQNHIYQKISNKKIRAVIFSTYLHNQLQKTFSNFYYVHYILNNIILFNIVVSFLYFILFFFIIIIILAFLCIFLFFPCLNNYFNNILPLCFDHNFILFWHLWIISALLLLLLLL